MQETDTVQYNVPMSLNDRIQRHSTSYPLWRIACPFQEGSLVQRW
jgi:hypothetical protein